MLKMLYKCTITRKNDFKFEAPDIDTAVEYVRTHIGDFVKFRVDECCSVYHQSKIFDGTLERDSLDRYDYFDLNPEDDVL